MLTENLDSTITKRIEVVPKNIVVALNDDAQSPLYLTLPPLEELRAIRDLADLHISVNEIVADAFAQVRARVNVDLERLMLKREKFGDSLTYLNHLANLAELAEDYESGERYLRSALSRTSDSFIKHRLEANLLRQLKLSELEASLSGLNAVIDYESSLHLSYSAVLRNQYDQALAHVSRAVALDPIDYRGRMLAGALYLYRGEYQKAIQNFRIAADERENSSALFVNLAVAYFCLFDVEKSLKYARRAVAINPMDQNAIAIYADLTFREGKNAEAIPYLQKFVRYEQKNPSIWSRLARAYFYTDQFNDALVALKNEAAIHESPAVWNNIGVVYSKKRDHSQALKYYYHAIRGDAYKTDESAQLALSNMLLLLNEKRQFNEVIKFAAPIIHDQQTRSVAKNKQSSGAFLAYLRALSLTGRVDQAIKEADTMLSYADASAQLRVSLLSYLLNHYSLNKPNEELAIKYSRWALQSLTSCEDCDPKLKAALINNIAFASFEFGRLECAKEVLPLLSKAVHSDPYSTATLGLYHLRKGNITRGESLYKESIEIAVDQVARESIRQKMNLELGKFYIVSGDKRQAGTFLQRAARVSKHSIPPLQKQANALLKTIKDER